MLRIIDRRSGTVTDVEGLSLELDETTGSLRTAAGFRVVIGENNELSVDVTYELKVWSDVPGDPVQDLSDVRQALLGLGIEPTETKSVLDDGTRTVDLEWQLPLDFTLDQRRRHEQLLDRWAAEPNMGVELDNGVVARSWSWR